jgi:hypothetical protein
MAIQGRREIERGRYYTHVRREKVVGEIITAVHTWK